MKPTVGSITSTSSRSVRSADFSHAGQARIEQLVLLKLQAVAVCDLVVGVNRVGDLYQLGNCFREPTVFPDPNARQNCRAQANRFWAAHPMQTAARQGSAQLETKGGAASAARDIEVVERSSHALQELCHEPQFAGDPLDDSFVDMQRAGFRTKT